MQTPLTISTVLDRTADYFEDHGLGRNWYDPERPVSQQSLCLEGVMGYVMGCVARDQNAFIRSSEAGRFLANHIGRTILYRWYDLKFIDNYNRSVGAKKLVKILREAASAARRQEEGYIRERKVYTWRDTIKATFTRKGEKKPVLTTVPPEPAPEPEEPPQTAANTTVTQKSVLTLVPQPVMKPIQPVEHVEEKKELVGV